MFVLLLVISSFIKFTADLVLHSFLGVSDFEPGIQKLPHFVMCTIRLACNEDAEPDALVHSTSAIIDHFSEKGIRCNTIQQLFKNAIHYIFLLLYRVSFEIKNLHFYMFGVKIL